MANNIDMLRFSELGYKVKSGIASKSEKDEYMRMLYNNGSITKDQFDKYNGNQDTEGLIKLALAVGGILVIAHLLSRD
ncbi:MAG: hypothetical protein IPP51_00745 [Bacteroidetes bacterium]|nr:hypothetical protein [Bacteroidota bacterium]